MYCTLVYSSRRNVCRRNVVEPYVTPSHFRPLPHSFVLYAPLPGGSSLSLGLGQLWLNLDLVGPSHLNRLPPSARASFLSSNLSTSLSLLKTCLFSWVSRQLLAEIEAGMMERKLYQ